MSDFLMVAGAVLGSWFVGGLLIALGIGVLIDAHQNQLPDADTSWGGNR